MNKLFKLVMFSVAIFSFSTANATPEMKKIGVVFPSKIIAQSPQREKSLKKLKQEFSKRENELKSLQKAIYEINGKLGRDVEMMSPNEVAVLKREVEVKSYEYEVKAKALNDDVRLRQSKEQKALISELGKVVNSVAVKGGYDLILNGEQIVYAKPEFDISDIVIKELSKK